MTGKRVKSKKTGRVGYCFRFSDPVTGMRTKRTFWYQESTRALRALNEYLDERQGIADGLPAKTGWTEPYAALVKRFLNESDISSETRREVLARCLQANLLGLKAGADLDNVGKLTAGARKIAQTKGGHFARHYIQAPLKQLSRWLATVRALPYDPLATWKRLAWGGHKHRRAFAPDEVFAILAAASWYDAAMGRKSASTTALKTLLLAGNRITAILAANVGDLQDGRIMLPKGEGKKHNGFAAIPRPLEDELRAAFKARDQAKPTDPLLVSAAGARLDRCNLRQDFARYMALGFTFLEWPEDPTEAEPLDVAHLIQTGRHRGLDGRKPTDPAKIEARKRRMDSAAAVAESIGERVRARMERRTLYSFKHTHISWARRLANPDAVREQVGHAPRDTQERHYLDADFVNARESAAAVWAVLTGVLDLDGREIKQPVNVRAVLVEGVQVLVGPVLAPVAFEGENLEARGSAKSLSVNGIPGRIRTSDLNLRRVALYPG